MWMTWKKKLSRQRRKNTPMGKGEGFFEESKQQIVDYLQDRLLLFKLDVVERGAKLIATMFTILIVALFAFFVLLFLSVMAAFLFGELLHHIFWGFAIVAAFYVILLALVIGYRKKIMQKYIVDIVIGIVFEKAKEENKEEIKADDNAQ